MKILSSDLLFVAMSDSMIKVYKEGKFISCLFAQTCRILEVKPGMIFTETIE